MDKLKPIIEPLLTEENGADIIEQLSQAGEEVTTREEIDNLNRDWSERFKKAFFTGEGTIADNQPEIQAEEQAGVEEFYPTRYEDLFRND